MSLLCGTSADKCTLHQWFKFLGTYNKWVQLFSSFMDCPDSREVNVPFDIDVVVTNTTKKNSETQMSMTEDAFACGSPSDMSPSSCPCQDCPVACEVEEPYPNLDEVCCRFLSRSRRCLEGCKMASMDCGTAMTLLAFGSICLTGMFIVVAHYVLKHSTDDQADAITTHEFNPSGHEHKEDELNRLPSIEQAMRILCIRYSRVRPFIHSFYFNSLL